MLVRVSAALTQFLAPIPTFKGSGQIAAVSPQKGDADGGGAGKNAFEKYQKPIVKEELAAPPLELPREDDAPENLKERHLKAVPDATGKTSDAASKPKNHQISNGSAFLQFFKVLSTGREKLSKIFAFSAYQKATKGQKKGAKFRKGAMFDLKAG